MYLASRIRYLRATKRYKSGVRELENVDSPKRECTTKIYSYEGKTDNIVQCPNGRCQIFYYSYFVICVLKEGNIGFSKSPLYPPKRNGSP